MKYLNLWLLAISCLILMSGSGNADKITVGYYPGKQLPNFLFCDVEGNAHQLNEYRGSKVVINFWASYDAQSRANNVQLHNHLRENHPSIKFISISFDTNKNVFQRTARMDNLDEFSQFFEVEGTASEMYKNFRLNRGFRSYLVDENGVVMDMNVTPNSIDTKV